MLSNLAGLTLKLSCPPWLLEEQRNRFSEELVVSEGT